MAIIRSRQIREMSGEDLAKRLVELKLELSKERSHIAVGGAPTGAGKVKQLRITIARILTERNMRKIKGGS